MGLVGTVAMDSPYRLFLPFSSRRIRKWIFFKRWEITYTWSIKINGVAWNDTGPVYRVADHSNWMA